MLTVGGATLAWGPRAAAAEDIWLDSIFIAVDQPAGAAAFTDTDYNVYWAPRDEAPRLWVTNVGSSGGGFGINTLRQLYVAGAQQLSVPAAISYFFAT